MLDRRSQPPAAAPLTCHSGHFVPRHGRSYVQFRPVSARVTLVAPVPVCSFLQEFLRPDFNSREYAKTVMTQVLVVARSLAHPRRNSKLLHTHSGS